LVTKYAADFFVPFSVLLSMPYELQRIETCGRVEKETKYRGRRGHYFSAISSVITVENDVNEKEKLSYFRNNPQKIK
jgi:hypothetical protein